MNFDLDLDCERCESTGATGLTLSSSLGPSPFVTYVDDGPYRPPGWRLVDSDVARCVKPSRAAGCKRLVLRAWAALATMKLAEGQARIESMDVGFDTAPIEAVELDRILLRATCAALNDDAGAAARLAGDALKACEGAAAHPATSLLLRLGHWKARRLEAFCELSRKVVQAPARRREALWSILHLSMEAAVEAEQLRLATAGRLADEALEMSARFFGPDFPGGRMAATLAASILYERDQVDAADRLLRDRLALFGSQGGIEGALRAYVVSARIAVARRQVPFAVLLLREAELLGEERDWPRLVATSLAERVRLLLADGRLAEAEDCARRLARTAAKPRRLADDDLPARDVAISRARLESANGASAHTVSSLQRIVADCMSRRECHLAVELRMLLACTLHELGRDDEATTEATGAIELGATAGLYRTFIDGGEATRGLLEWLFERRIGDAGVLGELRPYVRNLLIGFPMLAQQAPTARTRHRSGDSLSPRERHILTLMSHGLSNKRIAKQLDIAPETVKSHAKHILLKLAAQTRVEAVSRAHSLGII
jgi:ATP/maltotriose-dependent transcriptional regulator MalT